MERAFYLEDRYINQVDLNKVKFDINCVTLARFKSKHRVILASTDKCYSLMLTSTFLVSCFVYEV